MTLSRVRSITIEPQMLIFMTQTRPLMSDMEPHFEVVIELKTPVKRVIARLSLVTCDCTWGMRQYLTGGSYLG